MSAEEFAEALRRLVGDAVHGGLDPKTFLDEIEDMIEALCLDSKE